jgi:hypothetical protein
MSTMISEVYDALIDAGASDDKARKAAETLANYDGRFNSIAKNIEEIKGEQKLLRWMISFNLAFTMAILWKVFS